MKKKCLSSHFEKKKTDENSEKVKTSINYHIQSNEWIIF